MGSRHTIFPDWLRRLLPVRMAVDLGSENLLVYVCGRGAVLAAPNVVTLESNTGRVLGFGWQKVEVWQPTHPIHCVYPLRDGVIVDFEVVEALIKRLHGMFAPGRLRSSTILLGTAESTTNVERRALLTACERAGFRKGALFSQLMAAAVGAGLDVTEPRAQVIVDVGGLTKVGVIRAGALVACRSARIGSRELRDAVIHLARRSYALLIGERTAEKILIDIGSAVPLDNEMSTDIKGRDLMGGLPKAVTISSSEVCEAVQETLSRIALEVREAVAGLPADVQDTLRQEGGTVLSGGCALMRGLDRFLSEKIEFPARVGNEPLAATIRGLGRVLEDAELRAALDSAFLGYETRDGLCRPVKV